MSSSLHISKDVEHSNRIVMTLWEPEFESRRLALGALQELIVNSMLYDKVMIKDSDIILNSTIVRFFNRDENFEMLKNLISADLLAILTLPVNKYPQNMHYDPQEWPIEARAEDIQERKTFKSEYWKPNSRQSAFYKKLDLVLRAHPKGILRTKGETNRTEFASHLARILRDRTDYSLNEYRQFNGIGEELAELMIRCCEEPGYWIAYLRNKGRPTEKTGEEGRYTRTGAYQVLAANRGDNDHEIISMKNLIQSIFNSDYCDNHGSDGQFGGRLIEAPYRFPKEEQKRQAESLIPRIEIRQSVKKLDFLALPEIGEILARTKEDWKGPELLSLLNRPMNEQDFMRLWGDFSDAFAENVSKVRIKTKSGEKYIWRGLPFLFLLADQVLGLGMTMEHRVISTASWLGPFISRATRTGIMTRKLSRRLRQAINVRFSRVRLSRELR